MLIYLFLININVQILILLEFRNLEVLFQNFLDDELKIVFLF
jgi:hypothetical protein